MKFKNIAVTYQPKFVSPFGDSEVYAVPAVNKQRGSSTNWVVISCSPSYNGVYTWEYDANDIPKVWKNKNLSIYYIPINKMEYVASLEEMQNRTSEGAKYMTKEVIKQQTAWINGKVFNQSKVYTSVPDWCLDGVKLKGDRICNTI